MLRLTQSGSQVGNHCPDTVRTPTGNLRSREVRKMLSWMGPQVSSATGVTVEATEVDLVVERPDDDTVIGIGSQSRVTGDSRRLEGLRILRDEVGSRFHAGLVMYTGDMHTGSTTAYTRCPFDKLWGGEPRAAERQPVVRGRPSGDPS